MKLTNRATWGLLQKHFTQISAQTMRDLFLHDPQRFQHFSIEMPELFLDYSKNRITTETVDLLCKLADECDLKKAIEDLFSGKIVNISENRAALHTALRDFSLESFRANNLAAEIPQVRERMAQLVKQVHGGELTGFSGKPITDVLHLGIGGSDLGPQLVYQALKPYVKKIHSHFISSPDNEVLEETFNSLNPETTLVIIVSKTFTTQETLVNAERTKLWLANASGDITAVQNQLVAVTQDIERARAFGILPERIFPMWDWLGGRFSLWSAVSLSVAISMGMEAFLEMLRGAHAMDQHFQTQEFSKNMPVILGLLSVWYVNFFGARQQAVIPYSAALALFPSYLQQLHMESLGKCVMQNGEPIEYATGPIIFGECGPNTQHSFHQLLFQGSHLIPVDFILPLHKRAYENDHAPLQEALIVNCFAQAQALMQGYSALEIQKDLQEKGITERPDEKMINHQKIQGNIPSNVILMEQLTPKTLGALIALYEHKVYVQSVLWGINAFDQWAVERGKAIARRIWKDLSASEVSGGYDASTSGLLKRVLALRGMKK